MDSRNLRLRRRVADNFWLIAGLLVVLTLAGGYVTYDTYGDPGVEVQTEQVSQWSSQGQFSHQATVINDTAVFNEGTVLRDRSAYFQRIAPVLNGSVSYSYEASDGGDVDVEGTLFFLLRSAAETQDGNATEYWRVEVPLGRTVEESVASGEAVRIPFTVNVSSAVQRAETIEEEIGGTPGEQQLVLRSQFDITGTINGQQVDRTRTYEATVSMSQNVYSVEGAGPTTDSGRQMREVTVPATYGPLRRMGGPLLSVVGFLGLAGLALAYHRDATTVSDDEREWLQYQSARDEFDNWITDALVPDDELQGTHVTIETLEGLVDVAIDSDRRVIYDRTRSHYLVSVDDTVYVYDPPPDPDPGADGPESPDPLADETRESQESESVSVLQSADGGETPDE